MMETMTDRNYSVVVLCRHCKKTFELKVRFEDYVEYLTPNRKHIQDIFPYLTPAERELLISNTCEECWNEMFADFE